MQSRFPLFSLCLLKFTPTHQKESIPKIEELKSSRENQVPVGYSHVQICTNTHTHKHTNKAQLLFNSITTPE